MEVTVGSFFHYITEQHSVEPAIHHYSCGLCTHSRSCWSSVQTWCRALDYPFALRETPLSNGTKWVKTAAICEVMLWWNCYLQGFDLWFFFGNFRMICSQFRFIIECKFPSLIFLHLLTKCGGWRSCSQTHLTNRHQSTQQMIETNTQAVKLLDAKLNLLAVCTL